MLSLQLTSGAAFAQSIDIGSVDVQLSGSGRDAPLPISSDAASSSKAPPGPAPAHAPSQESLAQFQPESTASDTVIRDVIPPSGDYNEVARYKLG
jgi:hypothetical protein